MANLTAITLWQPWATLIAIGAKEFETRHWAISFRGPIAIHAAKRFDAEQYELCDKEPFRRVLRAAGYATPDDLPLGTVVAVARLAACYETSVWARGMSDQERAFGDWSPGRYAWRMADVAPPPASPPSWAARNAPCTRVPARWAYHCKSGESIMQAAPTPTRGYWMFCIATTATGKG